MIIGFNDFGTIKDVKITDTIYYKGTGTKSGYMVQLAGVKRFVPMHLVTTTNAEYKKDLFKKNRSELIKMLPLQLNNLSQTWEKVNIIRKLVILRK